MARYLSGLCVASLGLCAGGWLIVTAVLLGAEPTDASLVSLGTGAGLAVVSAVGIACWSMAWRQRMRRDGVLAGTACPAPDGRAVTAVSPASAGPSPAGTAKRSSRVLRRDMRRAARAARRQARRRGASMGTIAYGESAARQGATQRAGAARRAGGAGRAGAARQDGAAIEAIRPPAAVPQDPALLLSEIRALLEPLLAAAHEAAVPGAARDADAVPRLMPDALPDETPGKAPDKRPAPQDAPAPVRTPAVAPREAPATAPVPRPDGPLAGACPPGTGDGEESW